ncbi:hypothetical protein [Halorarius halobius]|uniref:hypothetical protein n=1 Tax=Halorarius halobius TaxID=2962671 RepID=UPI0020CCADE9|nr:hypothetical protein [Halorarius halobius]
MERTRDAGLRRYARIASPTTLSHALTHAGATALFVTLLASAPAAAQSTAQSFCNTQMAQTIRNMFTVIQLGGPLLGGVLALGSVVAIPFVPGSDQKLRLKRVRNQALIWGVLVAPLGTAIITFLLNNVVAGGTSCGF